MAAETTKPSPHRTVGPLLPIHKEGWWPSAYAAAMRVIQHHAATRDNRMPLTPRERGSAEQSA